MTDTSGFYKNDDGNMLYAPNTVTNANYTLTRTVGAATTPTDGWAWFTDQASAYAAYGLTLPPDPTFPPGP
jgi:hypothetical protein